MQYINERKKLTTAAATANKKKTKMNYHFDQPYPVMNSDNESYKEKFHEFYERILLLNNIPTFKLNFPAVD